MQSQELAERTRMAEQQNVAHEIFMEYYLELSTVLVASTGTLSTRLWEENIILDVTFDAINDQTLGVTNHRRTVMLLGYIRKNILKRKSSQDGEKSSDLMEKFMDMLKEDLAWNDLVTQVEASLREAREDRDIECPEAQAIKANMDTLASRLTGSLVYIANAAYAKGLLLPQEKDIIDPNASKDRIYASKMLDEVGEKIKKKPEVYDKFIKILKELGGILTDISDEMKKKKEDKEGPNIN